MNHMNSCNHAKPRIVSGSRNEALNILFITPEEQVAFVTHLNYAVNNLSDVAGKVLPFNFR